MGRNKRATSESIHRIALYNKLRKARLSQPYLCPRCKDRTFIITGYKKGYQKTIASGSCPKCDLSIHDLTIYGYFERIDMYMKMFDEWKILEKILSNRVEPEKDKCKGISNKVLKTTKWARSFPLMWVPEVTECKSCGFKFTICPPVPREFMCPACKSVREFQVIAP